MKNKGHAQGIMWIVLAGLMFVAVTVLVRHLGSDLPAVQAAFIRYGFGLLLVIPAIVKMSFSTMKLPKVKLYVLRGLVHGMAVMLWFFAMARIPIAEVTAIGYTTPIFTALGAILIFGERIRFRRILAIIIGFFGTLIILRPGFSEISMGSLAQLGAAPCFAISFLLAKKLTQTEQSGDILVMLTIFCTLALLPVALWQWRTPQVDELLWLALVAVFATAGHYALTRAFAAAPLTVTQPFAFLQLVWAIIFGYLLFGEVPDIWVVLGGFTIVAAITYLTHREAVADRDSEVDKVETGKTSLG
jgi:drug/metabolite transporter (DMT)-like permease